METRLSLSQVVFMFLVTALAMSSIGIVASVFSTDALSFAICSAIAVVSAYALRRGVREGAWQ